MKKLSLFLISAFFLFKSSLAFSYDTDPQKFVTELIQDAISKLSDNNSTEDEKKEFIEKIAIENVDISALGLYTLGDLRKKVSTPIILTDFPEPIHPSLGLIDFSVKNGQTHVK